MRRRRTMSGLLAVGVCVSALLACERESTPPAATNADAAPVQQQQAQVEAFTPSRETPVQAARSIRHLAETTWDPMFVAEYIDPSQKWTNPEGGDQTGGAPALVGPALLYYARLEDLRSAAVERFGADAGPAVDEAASFFQIDVLGNGIREMFGAAKLE
ncbi:MAG: hypothetical protein ACTS27_06265, partial [Phycisphaerales bacterium]